MKDLYKAVEEPNTGCIVPKMIKGHFDVEGV